MDARHKLIATKAAEAFGGDAKSVEDEIKTREDVLRAVDDFLEARATNRLLLATDGRRVHVVGGVGSPSFESVKGGAGASKKLAYFVRAKEGKPVGVRDHELVQDLLCGELDASVMSSLGLLLEHVYLPALKNKDDWGKNPPQDTEDYLMGVSKFSKQLSEVMTVVGEGVELRQPEDSYVAGTPNAPAGYSQLAANERAVTHFESCLEEWVQTVERLLQEADTRKESPDAGPHTELEYWKDRTSKFNTLVDQKNLPGSKIMLGVLQVARGGSPLVRKWKGLDNDITDALNEAKDNVRFLTQLDKFLEPLYKGAPRTIIDALPALMNNLFIMQSVARYYNTRDKMTTLFKKITNQLVANCKLSIEAGGRNLWEHDLDELLSTLNWCCQLNIAYSDQFNVVREKLMSQPRGRSFELDRVPIFEKFDRFCVRLRKLMDMFSTVKQFMTLIEHKIDGMESLTKTFVDEVDKMRNKRYNLVEDSAYFEKDYAEFQKQIELFENSLQVFINSSFENIRSTEESLVLLKKFQSILQRENLKAGLDNKYMLIFHQYGQDLEQVQKAYDRHKHNPPLIRNAPPVAGNIIWSRQLYRRIEEPMLKFQDNEKIMNAKDSAKIIRTYNRVARALIEFETIWHTAWVRHIETAKAGLQATLIVRNAETGKLHVNFDNAILQLIRETKWLLRLGVEVPDSAKMVLLQEEKFKRYKNQLTFALKEYERVTGRINAVIRPMLQPHVEDLDRKILPGMVLLTWNSMNIDGYLLKIHAGVAKLEELVIKVNDIIHNRIDSNLAIISKLRLVDIPSGESFTLDQFVTMQQRHAAVQTEFLVQKNIAVERAVADMVEMATTFPFEDSDTRISDADVKLVCTHYNNMMFRSILNATVHSLQVLKSRIGSHDADGNVRVESSLFQVDVEFLKPNYVMNPSLDEIQEAINTVANVVLEVSKNVHVWRAPAQTVQHSYFAQIAQSRLIARTVLTLTGGVHSLRQEVNTYLNTFRKYDYLWQTDKVKKYQEFMQGQPTLEDFEIELKKYNLIEHTEIGQIPTSRTIGCLQLSTVRLCEHLKQEASLWKLQYAQNLHSQAKEKLDGFTSYISDTTKKLGREIHELEDLKFVMDTLHDIRAREATIDIEFAPVHETYRLLKNYDVNINKQEGYAVMELEVAWNKMVKKALEKEDKLKLLQPGYKSKLIRDVRDFEVEVKSFRNDFVENGPIVPGLDPEDAMDRLKRFQRSFEDKQLKYKVYMAGEELFGLKVHTYEDMDTTARELKLLDNLYSLYLQVNKRIDEYGEMKWKDLTNVFDEIKEEVETFEKKCNSLNKGLRSWQAYIDLKNKIENFRELQPLLEDLSNSSIMMPRHWREIMDITGVTFNMDEDVFKLQDVLDANLLAYKDKIEELCLSARKEAEIENKLRDVKAEWEDTVFMFGEFKNRGLLILKGAEAQEILERLEESQLRLNSMMSSRFVKPFKAEVSEWVDRISSSADAIERWLQVQAMWMYMEAVFSGGGDIARSLPQESKRFSNIDKTWCKIMAKAVEVQKVIEFCYQNEQLAGLDYLREQLESCQRSLSDYLEQKRNRFPRFYFVSDPVLLEILSQSSDPLAIQPHLASVFDSIGRVVFDKTTKNLIVQMVSQEGEVVDMTHPVLAAGHVEDWLNVMEAGMMDTIKDITRKCSVEALEPDFNVAEFTRRFPAQISLLGLQFRWTMEAEEALTKARGGDKRALPDANKRIHGILVSLTELTQDATLDKLTRRTVETNITIQMHQRDVFDEVAKIKMKEMREAGKKSDVGPECFDWQKQLRFYWQPDLDECMVSVTDVEFNYSYEYLGCKERLVVTPLTDRCYITLAQALGMYLGGAPAGPAGTGKTETVKDLGRALGKYVVVFNCSDQMDHNAMGKIFKGCAQSGAWGDFDEFNRIDLDVLSVVAQQIQCILLAIRNRLKEFQFTDGQVCRLRPETGYFITMNPGYQGRQELPENLKVLFRGVTMMMPDRLIIIKVKLAAAGYLEYDRLGKKFNVLYKLCEEQLSKQPHYDFGLRNILSVLRTAGAVRRLNPDKKEDFLLQRTLRDMNLSKLVAEDVPLLLSLINDLFPGMRQERTSHPEVEDIIKKHMADLNLVDHEPFYEKVIQLYETALVRHGIMVIGPGGSGKSCIYEVLLRTLSEVERPHREYRMNPKAILAKQMFGELDISNDWTDGIFSALWRKANKNAKESVWIICDGPVDAIWIENLNTVLDDNRLLTLANGDRLNMSETVKMCFEAEDLRNASPATVSRAGQIYVSGSVLGWHPPFVRELSLALAAQVEPEEPKPPSKAEGQIIRQLFETYMDNALVFARKQCDPVMDVMAVNQVTTCLRLMLAMIRRSRNPERDQVDEKLMKKLFFFALMWAVGGLLEPVGRRRFETEFIYRAAGDALPHLGPNDSIYDMFVSTDLSDWEMWTNRIPDWKYPGDARFDFSTLFVPTIDSVRIQYLLDLVVQQKRHALLIGSSGTAKTVSIEQYLLGMDAEKAGFKKINFSSATSPGIFQATIEASLEKKVGTTFVPKGGKDMAVFIDDLNMPEVNVWGDQPTNEIVRQVIEACGLYNLDKQKRGEWRKFERLQYLGAMSHPGGGKNDIPNRLKRHFSIFNVTLPSDKSLDQIFGALLRGRFNTSDYKAEVADVAKVMTTVSIRLWRSVQEKMLPTPAKFHYIFNLRDLSRVYQGICSCPSEVITTAERLLALWKHECTRVFADRLNTVEDKIWFDEHLAQRVREGFGATLADAASGPFYFVDFMRNPTEDAEGNEVPPVKVYEPHPVSVIKEKLQFFMDTFNRNSRGKGLELVLFDAAVKHLVRISRILRLPRGNALLVGVGGSGKQSLTRLATYIAGYKQYQIVLNKSYNVGNLLEELQFLYKATGQAGEKYTFVFTDKEIKEETFLEYINMIMTSGEIPGLFPKDELDALVGEMGTVARVQYPDTWGRNDSYDNLYRLFINRVRENLHIVLCFSPVGDKFRDRARKFPGLVSGCTMNWFFPWPEDALMDVATKFLSSYHLECDAYVRDQLYRNMASVHRSMADFSDQYFARYRRRVYSTPRSYLSFINSFKDVYHRKLQEVGSLARKIAGGLDQLRDAEEKIEVLKVELRQSDIELQKQQKITESMLVDISAKTATAQKKREEVKASTDALEEDFKLVEGIRSAAKEELDKAMPILERALSALDSITPEDIRTVKTFKNPPEFIKRIFDGVLLLNRLPVVPVSYYQLTPDRLMITDSFDVAKSTMLNRPNLTKDLEGYPKDEIDDEMVELLQPYVTMFDYTEEIAAKKAKEVAGLCVWVRAMAEYHDVAKVVEPKRAALREAEDNQRVAMGKLRAKQAELAVVEADLRVIEEQFESAVRNKQMLQEKSDSLRHKMESANNLIGALAGERDSWRRQSAMFQDTIRRLVGDVAMATAFISYCGAYNSQFRQLLLESFYRDLSDRRVPVTEDLNITRFLVDERESGEWNIQGLPKDDHSIQNGIMVTMSTKWPLLVDPQGQGLAWLRNFEPRRPDERLQVVQFTDKHFKFSLEEACREGWPLIIENVGEEIDPYMDPLLDKEITKTGAMLQVIMGDKQALDYHQNFRLYLTTKLANPLFTPELSAKTTIIDFTVTLKGLEDQLLARVIQRERKELEEQRDQLLREMNANQKKKQELEDNLLFSLSNSDKPLLENEELIVVLAETKKTSVEVEQNLAKAAETEKSINTTRESYRDSAARGSVLYFLMVEMSLVNPMYQTSLSRFLDLFDRAMNEAPTDGLIGKRVRNIIESLTFIVFVFVSRGLFEIHKPLYSLLLACEINLHAGTITRSAFSTLLKGGAALNLKDSRRKPYEWIPDGAWLNLVQLSHSVPVFRELCDMIQRNEFNAWALWYDSENPESQKVPDLHDKLTSFDRLLLVRSLRQDRTMLAAADFISETPTLERKEYVTGIVPNLEDAFEESNCRCPIIYLLSPGSDPTGSIYALAKKKKTSIDTISLGRGQEPRARALMANGFQKGTWLMLQNCHLGLGFMSEIEDTITKAPEVHENFRLWVTSEPHRNFPIGLLQMSIKLTNEPPRGIRAGLERSFQWVSLDMLERVTRPEWKPLLYTACFMHSIVQERRKFGPLGWNIPYEFNQSDLEASVSFLEKHMFQIGDDPRKKSPSYETMQYMVCEIHYGGRITDDKDRRLFNTYGEKYINAEILAPSFEFYPSYSIPRRDQPAAAAAAEGSGDGMNEIQFFRAAVAALPDVETPEVYGLHPNADLTFRMKESGEVLSTALDVQPKEGGGGGGLTREEEVLRAAADMLTKTPPDFDKDRCRERIHPPSEPLNIFILQEIDRLQIVISLVRRTLQDLKLAIAGTIIMSAELSNSLDCIYDGRVPANWLKVSWPAASLGGWFEGFLRRYDQMNSWVENGRPKAYWLAGWFNPQGFLTAVRQEVTRQHNQTASGDDKWTLDKVVLKTDVKKFERMDDVPGPPPEGCYIYGLFLEGASWSKKDVCLQEAEPKVLFCNLPVLHVSADVTEKKKRSDYYLAPVYKIPGRQYTQHVFDVLLHAGGKPEMHWVLRGVALLCTKE